MTTTPARPDFDNMKKQISAGITVSTGLDYVRQVEAYALHLEAQLRAETPQTVAEVPPQAAAPGSLHNPGVSDEVHGDEMQHAGSEDAGDGPLG